MNVRQDSEVNRITESLPIWCIIVFEKFIVVRVVQNVFVSLLHTEKPAVGSLVSVYTEWQISNISLIFSLPSTHLLPKLLVPLRFSDWMFAAVFKIRCHFCAECLSAAEDIATGGDSGRQLRRSDAVNRPIVGWQGVTNAVAVNKSL